MGAGVKPTGRTLVIAGAFTLLALSIAAGCGREDGSDDTLGAAEDADAPPPSVVIGTLTWADTGEPVSGAQVRADAAYSATGELVGPPTATTDAEGRFRIDGFPGGWFSYEASVGGVLRGRFDRLQDVPPGSTVDLGEQALLDFAVVEGLILGEDELKQDSATVRDLDSGEQALVPLAELAEHLARYR